MPAPIFTWAVAFAAQVSLKPRVLSAKFGDGYEQRVADGINSALESWAITVNSISEVAGASAIEAFLRTQAGVTAFQWTTRYGRTALFVCREWRRSQTGPTSSQISATFEEVPA